MGISVDRYSHSYINKLSQPTQDKKEGQRVREERKFDEVLISAGSRQRDEKRITEGLVQEVMSEVHSQTPQERIDVLKKAIEDGEYKVDADAVARRILLAEEEDE